MLDFAEQLRVLAEARVYGIVDLGYIKPCQHVTQCEALLKGGITVVQLRAKAASASERAQLLADILPLFENFPAVCLVNDDLELACRTPGVGLHIGQDDTPIETCREQLGPERIIGLSTHSEAQADAAMQQFLLNYFAVGPVFATQTKPDYEPVGLKLVRNVACRQPTLPWFCIGGINRQNVATVNDAGARAVVAVSDLLLATDTAEAAKELYQQMA